jgi:hypothetical protein
LIAGGVGKATLGGASPRADAEPSIWTVAKSRLKAAGQTQIRRSAAGFGPPLAPPLLGAMIDGVSTFQLECPRCGDPMTLSIDHIPVETSCPSCGQAVHGKVGTKQDLERGLEGELAAGTDPIVVEAIRQRLASERPREEPE